MCRVISMFLVALISFKVVSSFPEHNSSPFTMPASCKGQTYCLVKGDDYPDEEDINEVLQSSDLPLDFGPADRIHEEQNFEHVDGKLEGLECDGHHVYKPVYYIVDEQNRTRAVVQSEQYFEQKYELRWCTNEGHRDSTGNIFKNYAEAMRIRLSCDTSYLSYDFYVISLGKTLEMESVKGKLPVCCKCRYDKLSD